MRSTTVAKFRIKESTWKRPHLDVHLYICFPTYKVPAPHEPQCTELEIPQVAHLPPMKTVPNTIDIRQVFPSDQILLILTD